MLKTLEKTNVRPAFPAVCPNCRRSVNFISYDAYASGSVVAGLLAIFGVLALLIPPKKTLGCESCGHSRILTNKEHAEMLQLAERYDQYLRGELSEREFLTLLLACHVPFVQDVLAYKPDWECRECGESNPPDFSICFNCNWENPDLANSDHTDGRLPFIGGRHPWEM